MLRTIQKAILCVGLAAATMGCANKALTQDIKTQAEVDPRVDFSGMKTYGWMGAAGIVNDPEHLWTPPNIDVAAEIKYLIDQEMRARGWDESKKPDMAIGFLVVNDVQELKTIESERAGEVPDLVGVGKGAIVIELIDATTGKSIWLGAATGDTQTGRATEDTKARLKYAVKELFKQVP